jgi:hypothetical protein
VKELGVPDATYRSESEIFLFGVKLMMTEMSSLKRKTLRDFCAPELVTT